MRSSVTNKMSNMIDEYYLSLQEKAQTLNFDEASSIEKPFPGLKPFSTSEAHLFYGREGLSDNVLKLLLHQSKFLAILGASGSGKSSLVRAGLIPSLHSGKYQNEYTRWRIVICRPGNNPIGNLAGAFASTKIHASKKGMEDFPRVRSKIQETLNESSYGILEALRSFNDSYDKTLIIIDQFEELFRFANDSSISLEENRKFVDLLLTATGHKNSSVYTIITMRSEFLGECVKFRNLPEAINVGQYLIPRLTQQNIIDVIKCPIYVAGKEISQGLVNRLVDEIGDDMDQLPVLQHALMRTYNYAMLRPEGQQKLTIDDYEKIGTMKKALSKHATDIFNNLKTDNKNGSHPSRKQKIAKLIFQRLTDESTGLKGGRFPTPLRKLYAITAAAPLKATQTEVREVINAFRDDDTSFLMPPLTTKLDDDLVIDISHESLMRNWDLLIGTHKEIGWIQEEVENGKKYRQLHERRIDEQFITGSLLDDLITWKQNNCISAAWAKRYHNDEFSEKIFKKNVAFISKSFKEKEKSEQREIEKANKLLRLQRRLIYVGVAATIAIFILGGFYYKNVQDSKKSKELQYLTAQFETLKRSDPTLSYNSAKWLEKKSGSNNEFKEFTDTFDADAPFMITKLPLSSDLVSISYPKNRSNDNHIIIREKNSTSIWDIENGILKSKTESNWNSISKAKSGYAKLLKEVIVNGKSIFVVDTYKKIELRNENGKTIKEYERKRAPRNIEISKNGKYILIDDKVYNAEIEEPIAQVYNRKTKWDNSLDSILKLKTSELRVAKVAFLTDDKHIAVAYKSGLIKIINFNNNDEIGELVSAFKHPIDNEITALTIDNNDKYVIAATKSNTIDIWKLDSLKPPISKGLLNYKKADSVKFKRTLDTLISNRVKMEPENTLLGHYGSINSLSVSPDNQFVLSGSNDNLAMLWRIVGGERTLILRGSDFPIEFVGFTESEEIITSDSKSKFSIWKREKIPKFDAKKIKISPFDLYSRDLEKKNNAYKIYEMDSSNVNVEKLSGAVFHYLLSLPESRNPYPEDSFYNKGLDSSFIEVEKMFKHLVNLNDFKSSLNTSFKDLLFEERMNVLLREDDLLQKNKNPNKNVYKSKLIIETLNYYPKDSTSINSCIRYGDELIKLSKKIKTIDSLQAFKNLEIAERIPAHFMPKTAKDSLLRNNLWKDLVNHHGLIEKNFVAAYRVSDYIRENPSNGRSYWYNRSWYALFANEYEEAIFSAKKTLEIDKSATRVNTNLALGYLLNDQWDKAEKIYKKWNNLHFNKYDKETCNEVFLKDILDLEAEGIKHPSFENVRAILIPGYKKKNVKGIAH